MRKWSIIHQSYFKSNMWEDMKKTKIGLGLIEDIFMANKGGNVQGIEAQELGERYRVIVIFNSLNTVHCTHIC